MTIQKKVLTAIFSLCVICDLHAQDLLPVKFGEVTPEDFNVTLARVDSTAGAVVIADYGISTFEPNHHGWFDIVFRHSCRIKIFRQNAFDAATITIPYYMAGRESESILGLHASTYTLENGTVVETRLEDKSVFTDQVDKHLMQKKFTFPGLKEGAIVEYTYTQVSPFLTQLQPWCFQGEYPRLWSEYQVEMPHFFQYITIPHGADQFFIHTMSNKTASFNVSFPSGGGVALIQDNVVTHRWVMKDVPALKEEPFTTSMMNYLARLEFRLSRFDFGSDFSKNIMGTWGSVSQSLLKNEDFGGDLNELNGWMDEELKPLLQGVANHDEKARRIFAYVRDKFTCTAHNRLYMDDPLKTVFKNKHGNEAELNLLLVAMLRHSNIIAYPVILSTRDNGIANAIYPILDGMNYVVCLTTIGSSDYYLDASEPWLGFGHLPLRCYNGCARLLTGDQVVYVPLNADSMKESKFTLVQLYKDDKGNGLSGHLTTTPGFNEACELRSKLKTAGSAEVFKTIKTAYPAEYAVRDLKIDSLDRPDAPLQLGYDLALRPDSGTDLFYFNPMLSEGYKENPFKSADRRYPVEMPFAMDETYLLNMEVPDGYEIDELPQKTKVYFNDDQGYFEYLIVNNNGKIQLRSRIRFNKANFKPEDYASLRDFFGFVVKKQSEQIVFKKKKTNISS